MVWGGRGQFLQNDNVKGPTLGIVYTHKVGMRDAFCSCIQLILCVQAMGHYNKCH